MNGVSIGLDTQEKETTSVRKKTKFSYQFIKRLFDILVSGLSLIILSPIFLLIVILIRVDSKGTIIFKQKRIGKDGQPIYIYKFRSMVPDAEEILFRMIKENPKMYEEYQLNKKIKDDPRITKVGKFLRSTSLDELPQLLNILRGDMSLVGPRPYLHREINDMGESYSQIIQMTPGLTGLWQVSGRSDTSFKERCGLDVEYYKTRGLKTDIKIILKTFGVVVFKKGAK